MNFLLLDEIAKDLNMSTSNLKRALRIERNLTDSMKELLDKVIAKLTNPYQSRVDKAKSLFGILPEDVNESDEMEERLAVK